MWGDDIKKNNPTYAHWNVSDWGSNITFHIRIQLETITTYPHKQPSPAAITEHIMTRWHSKQTRPGQHQELKTAHLSTKSSPWSLRARGEVEPICVNVNQADGEFCRRSVHTGWVGWEDHEEGVSWLLTGHTPSRCPQTKGNNTQSKGFKLEFLN